MGRSKVRPDLRRRVVQACRACKAAKRRCDARKPCSRCVRQSHGGECSYETEVNSGPPAAIDARGSGWAAGPAAAPGTAADRSSSCHNIPLAATCMTESPSADIGSHVFLESSPSNDPRYRSASQHFNTAAADPGQILRDSQGEKLFLGPSSTLSFLQLLRLIFASHAGTAGSSFSQEEDNEIMFEADPTPSSDEDWAYLQNTSQLEERACNFFTATRSILNVCTKEEVLESVRRISQQKDVQPTDYPPLICLVIAIGAQCRARDKLDSRFSRAFSLAAHGHVQADMLLKPSIHSITLSLLMAFYLLTSYRRNAAYMYLGVAARAAHALGLHHRSSYTNTKDEDALKRLRLWKSLCVLDLMVCSILGRPPALNVTESDEQEAEAAGIDSDDMDLCSVSFEASFRASKIIGEILNKIYHGKPATPQDALRFLARLTGWRQSLPMELRSVIFIPCGAEHRQTDLEEAMGSMNMACFYYYAAVLLSRPFLVSHLSSGRRNGQGDATADEQSRFRDLEQLSRVCIDSAVYMIETVSDASRAGVVLNNTCFTKAWLFAAGLVLAFSMFFDPETSFQVKNAFESTVEFMRKESEISPHAKQYCKILEDIAAVIRQCHEQIARQRRESNALYVDRVFRFQCGRRLDENDANQNQVPEQLDSVPFTSIFPGIDEASEFFLSGWDDAASAFIGSFDPLVLS